MWTAGGGGRAVGCVREPGRCRGRCVRSAHGCRKPHERASSGCLIRHVFLDGERHASGVTATRSHRSAQPTGLALPERAN